MPIAPLQGAGFFVHKHTFYTLFPYISGYQFAHSRLSEDALRSAGELLAKIHLVSKEECSLNIEPRSFAWDKEDFLLRADALKAIIHQQEMMSEYDELALRCLELKISLVDKNKKQYEDFQLLQRDKHILHGDYHDENLFFDAKGNVTHVLDWEKVNYGPRGIDIARSLTLICFWDGFSNDHFDDAISYLNAYHDTYPVTKEYLKESIAAWSIVQIYSLWVLEGHYLHHNERISSLLQSHMRNMQYFATNENIYMGKLIDSLMPD